MSSGESYDSGQNPSDKRRHRRYPLAVQVELYPDGVTTPMRTATSEISMGGCYVEAMFTFPVGTALSIALWLDDVKVAATAKVATCFPQVGNGMEFTGLSAEDSERLRQFLANHEAAE
jgi:hypothetical protein